MLVAVSLGAFMLLGMAGLSVDIGRMYIAKSEAQSFVDAAALDAALQLDGTAGSLTRAASRVTALSTANKWQFGTSSFTSYQARFGTAAAGPFQPIGTAAAGSLFTRVQADVNVPLYFLPVVVGTTTSTVSAQAVAGRVPKTSFTGNVLPLTPLSHKVPGYESADDLSDPFGMLKTQKYTLRWAAGPKVTSGNVCPGDANTTMIDLAQAGGGSERGYFGPNSANDLRDAIQSDSGIDIDVSDVIDPSGGAKATLIFDALQNRINQDSDPVSTTYAAYKAKIDACAHDCADPTVGNGRRVVAVPVNTGHPGGYTVAGFAAFFLLTPSEYDAAHGNDPGCAEYIGPWVEGSPNPGGGTGGAYSIRLIE